MVVPLLLAGVLRPQRTTASGCSITRCPWWWPHIWTTHSMTTTTTAATSRRLPTTNCLQRSKSTDRRPQLLLLLLPRRSSIHRLVYDGGGAPAVPTGGTPSPAAAAPLAPAPAPAISCSLAPASGAVVAAATGVALVGATCPTASGHSDSGGLLLVMLVGSPAGPGAPGVISLEATDAGSTGPGPDGRTVGGPPVDGSLAGVGGGGTTTDWGVAPAMILFGVIGPSVGFVEGGWVELEVVGGIPLEDCAGDGGGAAAAVGATGTVGGTCAGAWLTDGKEAVAGSAEAEAATTGTDEGAVPGAATAAPGAAGTIPAGPPTACFSTGSRTIGPRCFALTAAAARAAAAAECRLPSLNSFGSVEPFSFPAPVVATTAFDIVLVAVVGVVLVVVEPVSLVAAVEEPDAADDGAPVASFGASFSFASDADVEAGVAGADAVAAGVAVPAAVAAAVAGVLPSDSSSLSFSGPVPAMPLFVSPAFGSNFPPKLDFSTFFRCASIMEAGTSS
uniref:Uncharacterized protein n=1 Tax=Anopheles dirus TaxID=7168 RepID=A0A182N6Q1_9DIPT